MSQHFPLQTWGYPLLGRKAVNGIRKKQYSGGQQKPLVFSSFLLKDKLVKGQNKKLMGAFKKASQPASTPMWRH